MKRLTLLATPLGTLALLTGTNLRTGAGFARGRKVFGWHPGD
jgi:hypothetical protein